MWKPAYGYPNYEVSDRGEVRNIKTGQKLKQYNTLGYRSVSLTHNGISTNKRVHRLVLESFIGPSNLVCNHKNYIRHDNRLSNLEWCTPLENNRHALLRYGKLRKKDVVSIVSEYEKSDKSNRVRIALAKKYNVDRSTVYFILQGKIWSDVTGISYKKYRSKMKADEEKDRKYYLKVNYRKRQVSRQVYIKWERHYGFYPKSGNENDVATSSFKYNDDKVKVEGWYE